MSRAPVTRPYRGVAAGERVAARRARLLAACLEEVALDGVAAVTVRAVADRAGLTRRYFYESFSDRDALLAAAFDTLRDEIAAAIGGALEPLHAAGAGFDQRARAAIAAALAVVLDTPAKARLLLAANEGTLAPRRAAALDAFVGLVAAELPPETAPEEAALRARMITGGLIEAVDAWLRGALAPDLDRDALVARTAALAAALARG